jgi:hypothetical protein
MAPEIRLVGGTVARLGKRRGWVYGLAALAATAWCSTLVAAGEMLRFTYNVPGDSKPIVLHADEMTTWMDGGRRIILLKGKVLVEHGVVEVRMQQGVIWLDQAGYRSTGIFRVTLYGEGEVTLDSGPDTRSGERALIDLNTRGEIKLKAHNSKVSQQPRPNDPLFRRAQEARAPSAKTSSLSPVQQAAFQAAAPALPALLPDQNLLPPQAPVGPPALGPPLQATPSASPASLPAPPVTLPAVVATQALTPTPPLVLLAMAPATGTASPAAPSAAPGGTSAVPAPGVAAPATPALGVVAPPTLLAGPPKVISILPRTSSGSNYQSFVLQNGEHVTVVTGGIILLIRNPDLTPMVDIEADRLVFWTRNNPQQLVQNLQSPHGQTTRDQEFYLAGNVEIRQQDKQGTRTLRANEVYYDVSRNLAVAMQADLEFREPNVAEPVHLRAEELVQLSPTLFQGLKVHLYSSRLASDPGLVVQVADATLEDKIVAQRSIFGFPIISRQTGQPLTEEQRLFTGQNAVVRLDDVPVAYSPYLRGDANDPLGPLASVGISYNQIFGVQLFTTLNAYNLFGIDPYPGTTWKLDLDYLAMRGPILGSTFDYADKDFFGLPAKMAGSIKAYGMSDLHTDNLGGVNELGQPRGTDDNHPELRGRFTWMQNVQDLPNGFSVQFQISALSDPNYLEQYFKNEFDNQINPQQETFQYVKQQQDQWAWTLLGEERIRYWVTETSWLPRADGYVLGQSFFDRFVYNVHASAGYAQLQPTSFPPPPVEITQQKDDTGRFDLMQELSLPFTLGPMRLVPYGVLDLTEYTQDLEGQERGRFYGGGGLRGSIPFTRVFPDVHSDLLNLDGINHKIVVSGNYYIAHSDTPYTILPQLDPLNDDATDQSLRDIKPREQEFNPANGLFISTSPIFDPQLYAIRRLLLTLPDTLDSIQEFQGDLLQRLQTKRGYPGQEHIVDWMVLDLSATYFPQANQNFGQSFGFLEYNWIWNIGDQTQLYSNGLTDPATGPGTRYYTIGASFLRSDRTTVSLAFTEIDPLESRAVSANFSYVFSPKYAMAGTVAYDFGTGSQFNQVTVTRMGSDLQVGVGFYYDSVFQTFGVNFQIVPVILPPSKASQAIATVAPSTFGGR